MKTLYNLIIGILLVLPSLLVSCKDDYMETNLGNQPLVMSASEQDIQLDITAPQSNAVTFQWTSGSNFNTNAAITYTFELGLSGRNFANSIKVEQAQGKNSISYSTAEVNAILLNQFGVTPGVEAELEARVTAVVHHESVAPQVSEVVRIKVTGYRPVSSTLYIIGDAAPNGWDANEATKMNTVSGAAGGFVWQGKLKAGSLKFITTPGQFLPSYNKGSDNTKLFFRESESGPDDKFVIPTTGIYKISVNIINLTIHIEALDAPEYSELWFVGNPTGWSFKPMAADASDPFIFYYHANLSAGGEFKIATQANFDQSTVFLRPATNGQAAGKNLSVVKWSESERPGGANDYKWNITGGVYKIRLDIRDMKIDIVPFTPYPMIYLVGDASPNGWDIGNATPMVAVGSDPYKFTWTGTLKTGELKFSCDKKSDWNGDWFLAGQAAMEPSGDIEKMIFSANGANPDNKWKITTAGTYIIELEQLQQTVKIRKQ